MKRNLLFALFAVLMGLGIVKAENINITVDNAANVEVSVNYGETILTLQDGFNRFTEYTSANSPLIIKPANGASIVSVTKNGTDVLNPNYQGNYTIGIEAMMLDIITESGEAPGEQTVDVWFQLNGAAGSATITCDGEDVVFSSTSFDYATVKSGADCLIAPAEGYEITKVEGDRARIVDNEDGTWTYSTTENMTFVTVSTEALPIAGTLFKVVTAYYPNLTVVAGRTGQEGEEYQWVPLAPDGSAVLPEGFEFINFWGADDASIVTVKRNGTAIPYSDFSNWRSMVDEGDVFEVITRGPEKTVTFYANNFRDGVGLEYFNITSDGQTFDLSGESATATLRRGADVAITGKGANVCNWVMCGNNYMAEPPFVFNLENNDLITVAGTAVGGVHIVVNDASAVVVKQSNGYGDALALDDGENTFELADIRNNLSVAAAEGCEIISLVVNQTPAEPTSSGAYSIVAAEGMKIEINARHIPTHVPLTIMVCDSEADNATSDRLAANVTLTVAGEVVELQALTTYMAPYQAEVSISGGYGFVIDSVDAGNNFVQESHGTYTFFAEVPCTLVITMHEIVAPEGYALVYFQTNNEDKVSFLPYDSEKDRLDGSFNTSQPGVVKIGNYIGVKKFSFDLLFKSITVNGESIAIDEQQEPFQEYFVKIEGDCTISALLYDPNEGTAPIICWDAIDGIFGLLIADLYVNDNGTLTKKFQAIPGEVVEFVVPYVAPGHNLLYIEGQSAVSPDLTDTQSFKFTVPETIINPESGDTYNFIFKPVIEVDTDNPPFVVEFFPTYVEEDGFQQVCGYLVGIEPYGNKETIMMFATEGTEIDILSYERDDYQFVKMFVAHGNTDGSNDYFRDITSPYTVDPDDAWQIVGHSKINIAAEYKPRESSLADVAVEAALSFNAATGNLEGVGEIRVFSAAGMLVASGTDTVSVANLADGLYIAVSGKQALKFIKK